MKDPIPKLTQLEKSDNKKRKEYFLSQLSSIPHHPINGFFGPNSSSWQLYREPLVLIGGIRALLLQIAHPAIADGVNRFSNFQEDGLERGKRTFIAMAKIYFGDAETAKKVAIQLHTIHSFIRGTYIEKNGNSRDYCANDPDLLLWVLATLIDTTFIVFDTINGKLPRQQKEQFYQESKTTALLMGIPPEHYPPSLSHFETYFASTIETELNVDNTSLSLANSILNNRYSSKRVSMSLAAGFLPPSLIQAFDIDASPKSIRRFKRIIKWVKLIYSLIPPYLRYAPAWHQAHFRRAKEAGRKGKVLGRFYHWLSKRMSIPLGI